MPASIKLWAYGAMTGELLTMPRVVLQSMSCELQWLIAASGHPRWDGLTVPLLTRATNPHSRRPEMRLAKGLSWHWLRWHCEFGGPNMRNIFQTGLVKMGSECQKNRCWCQTSCLVLSSFGISLSTTNPSQAFPGVSDLISLLAQTPHFT